MDRLAAVTEPVVCLVAPPGYGKTTVAAQWAERKGGRVAWVALDRRDNDPPGRPCTGATARPPASTWPGRPGCGRCSPTACRPWPSRRCWSWPGPAWRWPTELRLLPLMSTHLSFGEIGGRLFVSRHTVKTQAISVYRKLGVSCRSEAIERVRELGLL